MQSLSLILAQGLPASEAARKVVYTEDKDTNGTTPIRRRRRARFSGLFTQARPLDEVTERHYQTIRELSLEVPEY